MWLFGAPGADSGSGTWHYNGKTWTRLALSFAPSRASALSATSIWTIGRGANGDTRTIGHYNGKTWRTVALRSLFPADSSTYRISLQGIYAVSAKSVWVVGHILTPNTWTPVLLNWDGSAWHKVYVPGTGQLQNVAPDGRGGILVSRSLISPIVIGPDIVSDRSASGRWTTLTVSGNGNRNALVSGFTPIPGTTSVWGAGVLRTVAGSDGAIYLFKS